MILIDGRSLNNNIYSEKEKKITWLQTTEVWKLNSSKLMAGRLSQMYASLNGAQLSPGSDVLNQLSAYTYSAISSVNRCAGLLVPA